MCRGHGLGFFCLFHFLLIWWRQFRTEELLGKPSRPRDIRMLLEVSRCGELWCVWGWGLSSCVSPRTADRVASHFVQSCAMALAASPTRWPPAPQPFTCNSSCLMWHRWVWAAAQSPLFPSSFLGVWCFYHSLPHLALLTQACDWENFLKEVYCKLFAVGKWETASMSNSTESIG